MDVHDFVGMAGPERPLVTKRAFLLLAGLSLLLSSTLSAGLCSLYWRAHLLQELSDLTRTPTAAPLKTTVPSRTAANWGDTWSKLTVAKDGHYFVYAQVTGPHTSFLKSTGVFSVSLTKDHGGQNVTLNRRDWLGSRNSRGFLSVLLASSHKLKEGDRLIVELNSPFRINREYSFFGVIEL